MSGGKKRYYGEDEGLGLSWEQNPSADARAQSEMRGLLAPPPPDPTPRAPYVPIPSPPGATVMTPYGSGGPGAPPERPFADLSAAGVPIDTDKSFRARLADAASGVNAAGQAISGVNTGALNAVGAAANYVNPFKRGADDVRGVQSDAAASEGANRGGGAATAQDLAGLTQNPSDPYQAPQIPTLAQMGSPALSQRYGGGGGSQSNGLKSAYDAAQQKQLQDFDTDKYLQGELGDAEVARRGGMAKLNTAFAQVQMRDAQIQKEADEAVAQKHEAYLTRMTQLADDIGSMKVDPRRLYRTMDTGEKGAFMIGSMLGGAVNPHGINQTLDRYERMAHDDLSAQEKEIDNKRAQFSARQSVFQQMLAETGDRRIAAASTRSLMYEGMKAQIAAQAEDATLPTVKLNAQIAIQEIQKRQDAFDTELKRNAYQTWLAQAGAAAAAQRAAEEKAWQRTMDVWKMGLETDKVRIEASKANKSGDDEVRQLSTALADPKLANGRAALEDLKKRLAGIPSDEGIPGVGPNANMRERLAGPAGGPESSFFAYTPAGRLANAAVGLNTGERIGRQESKRLFDAYRVNVTGAGASAKELDKLEASFMGANTAAEQRSAIGQMDSYFKQIESAHRAGFSPQVNATYDARLNALNPQMPASVQPDGIRSDERAKQFAQKMGGGGKILSDARAKEVASREAYLLGRAHGQEAVQENKTVPYAYGGPARPGEDIVDRDPGHAGSAMPGPGGGPQVYAAPSPAGRDPAQGPVMAAPPPRPTISQLIGVDRIPSAAKAAALRVGNATSRAIDTTQQADAGAVGGIPSDDRLKRFAQKLGRA